MPKTDKINTSVRRSTRVAGKNQSANSPVVSSTKVQASAGAPRPSHALLSTMNSPRFQPGRKLMMQARLLRQSTTAPQVVRVGSSEPPTRSAQESIQSSVQSMEACTQLLETLAAQFSIEVEKVTSGWVALREGLVQIEEENVRLEACVRKAEEEAEEARACSTHYEGALRNAEVLTELLRGEIEEEAWDRVTGGYSQAK
ncbi:hypothetical protein BKA70DRAFT_1231908 [Coprinopsis sp. MPI-PUGE-AT-0042]|nr:hypothetical protein BKA70DRAFT_1231908 [Coprinopsis sp. MPI-PUGE-AT-0042]